MADYSDLYRALAYARAGGGRKTGPQQFAEMLAQIGAGLGAAGTGIEKGLEAKKTALEGQKLYKEVTEPEVPVELPLSPTEQAQANSNYENLIRQKKAEQVSSYQSLLNARDASQKLAQDAYDRRMRDLQPMFQQRNQDREKFLSRFSPTYPLPQGQTRLRQDIPESDLAQAGLGQIQVPEPPAQLPTPQVPEVQMPERPSMSRTVSMNPKNYDLYSQAKLREAQMRFLAGGGKSLPVSSLPDEVKPLAFTAGLTLNDTIPIEKFNALVKAGEGSISSAGTKAGAVRTAQNQADIKSGFGLDKESIDMLAKRYLAGQQDAMGLGTKIRGPVFRRAAEIQNEVGDTVGEQMSRTASYQADKIELNNVQKQRGLIMSFETTAKRNLDNFLGTINKISDTNSPILNIPLRRFEQRFGGDPNLAAFGSAGLVAQNEIAKVLQGGMSGLLTNEARQEAERALKPEGATLNQIRSSVEVLLKDLENRKIGYEQQIQETQSRIKDSANFFRKKSNVGNGVNGGGRTIDFYMNNPNVSDVDKRKAELAKQAGKNDKDILAAFETKYGNK